MAGKAIQCQIYMLVGSIITSKQREGIKMTKLERVCNTLNTQGGVLAQYAEEYIEVNTCFGSWHKHCPEGSVLCYGKNLLTEEPECRITDSETYKHFLSIREIIDNSMFLLPINKSQKFDIELCLHDRY
jgi:hypothetical protein